MFAFIEDAGASGGYMLACAGDEIFADPSSLVGSIGVIAAGFGFDKLLDRFGVERRLHTAGTSKAMLDPFSPERPEDVARLKGIQAQIHDDVRGSRRGPPRPGGSRATGTRSSPARSGPVPRRSSSASSTASAIYGRRCASVSARRFG